MKTDLSHLPAHKQAELKAIVAALIPRYTEIAKWRTTNRCQLEEKREFSLVN